ncbi:MAG: hypothetical protein PHI98_14695 [Eubacteriales bacterium]|nr:hypothetical protein [Eubacteriales bacterium]
MIKVATRLCAFVLMLCLLGGAAMADTLSLDRVLSEYFDINDDVRMSISFEFQNLPPFGDDMLGMINGVMKHVAMNAEIVGGDTALGLAVDGLSLAEIQEKEENGRYSMTTSLLPNRILTGSQSPLDVLFADQEETEKSFDLPKAVAEAEKCYQKLTDAIEPYAEAKKANYKITNIGYAKWVQLARLTEEQSAALLPAMIDLLSCGMDDGFRQSLQQMTCKNGFTIALYQTKEMGDDLAVYMKGSVSLGENDTRTLSYLWAFTRTETGNKDSYKLELIRSKAPAERRVVEGSLTATNEKEKLSVTQKSTATFKDAEGTVAVTEKHSLKGQTGSSETTLTGTISTEVKTTVDGSSETVTTELEPELTLTSAEGSGVLSGTVGMVKKLGKKEQLRMTVRFDKDPATALSAAAAEGTLYAVADNAGSDEVTITIGGSSLAQNLDEVELTTTKPDATVQPAATNVGEAPVGMTTYTVPKEVQTVDLDTADEAVRQALREEMAQYGAGYLLKALVALPDEDGALLKDNMTDEDFATFMNRVSGL